MVKIIDLNEFLHNTGRNEFHSAQTIELGELVESGIFTWESVNWKDAAFSDEQYERLCAAFVERFYLREIGITPVGAWFKMLHYELVYKLMPKYKPLYAQVESGYDPLQTGGEYRKERKIESDFPETLLSANQDYASSGYEFGSESVGRGNFTDDYFNYVDRFTSIDDAILNEIDRDLFSSLYTTNVNGW